MPELTGWTEAELSTVCGEDVGEDAIFDEVKDEEVDKDDNEDKDEVVAEGVGVAEVHKLEECYG